MNNVPQKFETFEWYLQMQVKNTKNPDSFSKFIENMDDLDLDMNISSYLEKSWKAKRDKSYNYIGSECNWADYQKRFESVAKYLKQYKI